MQPSSIKLLLCLGAEEQRQHPALAEAGRLMRQQHLWWSLPLLMAFLHAFSCFCKSFPILQRGGRQDRAGGHVPRDRESYVTESWRSPAVALSPSWWHYIIPAGPRRCPSTGRGGGKGSSRSQGQEGDARGAGSLWNQEGCCEHGATQLRP